MYSYRKLHLNLIDWIIICETVLCPITMIMLSGALHSLSAWGIGIVWGLFGLLYVF
jgi:hypothetical protein